MGIDLGKDTTYCNFGQCMSNETLLAAVDASANAAGANWGPAQAAKAGDNLALVEA
jgi:hypothetical protein